MHCRRSMILFTACCVLPLFHAPVGAEPAAEVIEQRAAVQDLSPVVEQPATTEPSPASPSVMPSAEAEASATEVEPSEQAAPAAEEEQVVSEPSSYMKLTGRIRRIKSGFIFVRTPVGTLTLFSEQGFGIIGRGQMVTLRTHDTSVVVDLHKKGETAFLRRYITGTPEYTTAEQNEIRLWTPEGGETFPLNGENGAITPDNPAGPITLQLDSSGDVVGSSQLHVDIQISDGTKKRQGTKMKLTGTVSKVNAGFAFIETPIGILTLSQKTGLREAKSGQEVTVWMNEHHLVIDVRHQGDPAPAHRFITGRVAYTAPDRGEIKLWTPEGEKTVPLPQGKKRLRRFRPGTPITVHFNHSGEVIEIRRAG